MDGKEGAIQVAAVSFGPAEGSSVVFQGGAREQVLLQELSRQQQRAEELEAACSHKEHLLAVLGHELRTPLAAMSNALQVIRQAGDNPSAARRANDTIDRQVRVMTRLVDDLLDASRISKGKIAIRRELIPLGPMLHDAVETMRAVIDGKRHTLTLDAPSSPLWLEADRARMTRAIVNLLDNAAKYTEPGGYIWLTAAFDASTITISVRDSGMGIAPEALPHVFNQYLQLEGAITHSGGGLGIGLALVKTIVELHGGTVEARSEGAGKGSEFLIRLLRPAVLT